MRSLVAALFLTITGSTFACASEAQDPAGNEDEETSDANFTAQSACNATDYKDAKAAYEKAIASAKQRKAGRACQTASTLYNIANQAGEAVKRCSTFSSVIRTSAHAAPLRGELKGSLAYATLIGELKSDFSGLDKAFAAGVTMYGFDQGTTVTGNVRKIDFAAGGKGSFQRASVDAAGNKSWSKTPLTYTIGRFHGPDSMATRVDMTLAAQGLTDEFSATPVAPYLEQQLILNWGPTFTLTIGDDEYLAYPTECTTR